LEDPKSQEKVEKPKKKELPPVKEKHMVQPKRSSKKKSTFTFNMPTSKRKNLTQEPFFIHFLGKIEKKQEELKKELQTSTPDTIVTFQNSLIPRTTDLRPVHNSPSDEDH
jgi:hypothetical protein